MLLLAPSVVVISGTAETAEGCRLMAEPAVPVFSTSFRPELMLGAANAMVPPAARVPIN